MTSAVTIQNITKLFGGFSALNNISFEVPEKSIFGVLGPNGAGKTTLFSIIAGFFPADNGTITVLGEKDIAKLKGRISILPQDALFQANIPIFDQLTYFLRLLGRTKQQAELEVYEALKMVDLDQFMFRESVTLSHGMYKRLALTQAFLGEPEVIILDEPTSGLDLQGARNIRKLIKELKKQATIIVSSHDMNEMRDLCDHVAFLNKGQLISVGSVDQVTGTSLTLECRLSRPLTQEEMEIIRNKIKILKIEQINPSDFSFSLEPSLSDEAADRESRKLLKALLSMEISIMALNQKNKLEIEYLKLMDSNTPRTAVNN